MWRESLFLALLCALPLFAQKYDGPRPPKPDLPYLVHADNLVPTEAGEAREQDTKEGATYTIAGASSPARTPLASPVFLLQSEKLDPNQLQLFRLEVNSKTGQREITFPKNKRKKAPRPVMLNVTKLGSDNLYRIEVDEGLERGEYSLTPSGSNQVFCFEVF